MKYHPSTPLASVTRDYLHRKALARRRLTLRLSAYVAAILLIASQAGRVVVAEKLAPDLHLIEKRGMILEELALPVAPNPRYII